MEPISIIVGALVTGATAAGKEVAVQAVKDAYEGLKGMIAEKFGSKAEVKDALQKVEKVPESEARKAFLKEELERAVKRTRMGKCFGLAKSFLELLKDQGIAVPSYHATPRRRRRHCPGAGCTSGRQARGHRGRGCEEEHRDR